MNDEQAARIFHFLTSAWPNKELPDETIDLWIEMIDDLDYEDAQLAAREIVRDDNWFPSVARFRQVCKAHAHRRNNHDAAARGLPKGGFDQPPAELISATRQLVDARTESKDSHWHGGPDPCPVCGGTRQARPSDGQAPAEAKYRRPPTYSGGPQIGAPLPAKAASYDQVYGESA